MIRPQGKEIPFQLTEAKGHRLATNVVVIIKSKRQPKQLVSDADGRLLLPVSETYWRENPQITWNYPGALAWAFNATASSGPGTNRATVYVSLRDKQKLVHDDLTVFYPPGFATPARETMCELEQARDFIARTLGLKPPSWGIVLSPELQTNTDYMVSGELESGNTWNYATADLHSGKLARGTRHGFAGPVCGPLAPGIKTRRPHRHPDSAGAYRR